MVAKAMFTAPFATRILHVSVADGDRPWRSLYCFHCRCSAQQRLSCSTVVHMEVGARSDVDMCAHFTGNNEELTLLFSIPDKKSFCPVWAAGLRLVSTSLPPDLGELHGDIPLSSGLRTAANQPSPASSAARVRAPDTGLPSLSRYLIISSRVKPYRAIAAYRSVLSHCLSLTVMIGFHSARLSSACSFSFPGNAEFIHSRKLPNDFQGRASG